MERSDIRVLAVASLSRISPRLRGGHAGYGESPDSLLHDVKQPGE